MRGLYDGFEELPARGEVWFAGANTETGFRGSYTEIANEGRLERLYIIKGGPGTGKSTLMRHIAEAAEKKGHSAVTWLCGSDPGSLDAAVIDGRIALADGTAPHTLDAAFPGAASQLVDAGRFWDAGMLEKRREEIESRAALKAAAYASASRWLAAAYKAAEEERCLAESLFDRGKAEGAAKRLAAARGKGPGRREASPRYRYDYACTMRGRVRLRTLRSGVEEAFVIEDAFGLAQLFLPMLADALEQKGWPLLVGMHPLGGRITGVKAGGASFTVGRDGGAPVRMTRFLRGDREARAEMRLAARIRESCLAEADARFAEAALHHFALEEIYGAAMDFDALRAYGRELRGEILARLEKN